MTRITQITSDLHWSDWHTFTDKEQVTIYAGLGLRVPKAYKYGITRNYNRVPMGKRSLRKVPKERREFVEAYRHRFNIWVGEVLPAMDEHMWNRLVAWKMAWGQ